MSSPTAPFTPGNVPLGTFTFLSSARFGLAAAVTGLTMWDHLHAGVDVTVPVLGDLQPKGAAQVRLAVRGPGDVTALDQSQVIRAYPPPDSAGAEPNLLAHVEFDRPDLPWMLTPYAYNAHLPPWLALVVLRDSRSETTAGRPGSVPVVSTRKGELQPLTDSWAWAHAQLLGSTADATRIADGLTDEYGLANLSRLLCPRRLEPQTRYLACVVPAFDIGRLAALGEPLPQQTGEGPPPPLAPAWTRTPGDDDARIELPVFYSWRFTTGERGDFEELAERLEPQLAPWYVGRRLVDTGQAFGEPGTGRLGVIEGPLVSPQAPDPASAEPTESRAAAALTDGWPTALADRLRGLLNQPADAADTAPDAGEDPPVPLIGPPIYGDRHIGRRRVTGGVTGGWFGELNLQPRHRAVAGLGTRVVQRDQDLLLQAAWNQLDSLREVNRRISQGQLAQVVNESLYTRLDKLSYGDLLQVARPTQDELSATPDAEAVAPESVREALAESATAPAASTAAFRRLGSARSPGELLAPGGQPADLRYAYDDRWVTTGATARAETVLPSDAALDALLTQDALKNNVVSHALDLVNSALGQDPSTDPVRAKALLRPLGGLGQFEGSAGLDARAVLMSVTEQIGFPAPEQFINRAKDVLDREAFAGVVSEAPLDDVEKAAAVRLFVEPPNLVTLLDEVDNSIVAEVIRQEPEVLETYSQAAAEVLTELVDPGVGEVVVVVTTETETVTETGPVTETHVLVDIVPRTDAARLAGAGVFVVPTTVTRRLRTGLEEEVGIGTFGADGGGAFADGLDVQLDLQIEALQQLDLSQEVLGELAAPDPSDGALVVLAPHLLEDEVVGQHLVDSFPDDAVIGWWEETGPSIPAVVDDFVVGCWDGEYPPSSPELELQQKIMEWFARRELPFDDVSGLCMEDLSEFLQNALWVHESIPPIPVSPEYAKKLRELYARLIDLTWPGTPVREPFAVARDAVFDQLAPAQTVPKAVRQHIDKMVDWVEPGAFTDGLHPVAVTPVFERAMHEALEAYDAGWVLPGMSKVPTTDLVTVVESNPAFVESFLVGLNHEMARELQWRGYPADLRGTYFHSFWSHVEELGELRDMGDDAPLGSHVVGELEGLLVLVVRGEIVRRYPDLIAVAVRADRVETVPGPDGPVQRPVFAGAGEVAPVVLQRHRDPDVLMVGFELTVEQVEQVASASPETQWWFLLAEHPAAPRFGLDVDDEPSWETFPTPLGFLDGASGPVAGWGQDSAHTADILLRDPVRAAFQAWPLVRASTPGAGGPG